MNLCNILLLRIDWQVNASLHLWVHGHAEGVQRLLLHSKSDDGVRLRVISCIKNIGIATERTDKFKSA